MNIPNTEVLVFLVRIRKTLHEVALVQKRFKESRDLDPRWSGYNFYKDNEYATLPEEKTLRILAVRWFPANAGIVNHEQDLLKVAQARLISAHGTLFRHLHIYLCRRYEGHPKQTITVSKPVWFLVNEIPYHKMRPEMVYLFPTILWGGKRRFIFKFNENQTELTNISIEAVQEL